MAKITFTKLGLQKPKEETNTITINNQEIIVKQFLPTKDKIDMIEKILTQSIDEKYGYFNPIKLDIITTLLIIQNYTNITFTESQVTTNLFKTMDLLDSGGVSAGVIAAIPQKEYDSIISCIEKCATAIEGYNNSIMGMISQISADQKNLEFDMDKIKEGLSGENLSLVKDILTKL